MFTMKNHRFGDHWTENALLKLSWKGEFFGVGMFEALAEMFPEHARELKASATMEWFNTRYCEPLCHEAGLHLSSEEAQKLIRMGAAFAKRFHKFENLAKFMIAEVKVTNVLYGRLEKGAQTPELKILAEELYEHENAIGDWFKSVLDGKPDGGEKIFVYLERHEISREDAVAPRDLRSLVKWDEQQLLLAYFPDEAAADKAVRLLKDWMRIDAIGILVKNRSGEIKQHKTGKRSTFTGIGIGIGLGIIASLPLRGLPIVRTVLSGAVGGGIIGSFFSQGIRLTADDRARISRELDKGQVAVGALVWDTEFSTVTQKLKEWGGTAKRPSIEREGFPLASVPG